MLAARNRRFRIAALVTAVASLIAAAAEIIDANRISGLSGVPGGYVVSAVILPAAHLVGACGWAVVGLAFGEEIDWPLLRRGGTIVASTLIAYFAAIALRYAVDLVDFSGGAQFTLLRIFAGLAALLNAVAACVVVSACAESRQGPARARWLRAGAVIAGGSFLAATVSVLFEQAYWSDYGAAPEFTIGAIVVAVGSFGLAAAAGIFARDALRPLGRREAVLAGAAALAAVATVCLAGGEGLIASGYSDPGVRTVAVSLWLGVGSRATSAVAIVVFALGARAATRT
jgi:hypothetical protein